VKERVRITDVSPRDGLQNEAGIIPTADKVRLIELLCATGVDEIEVTSFVSPKWVPQLGDAEQVLTQLYLRQGLAQLRRKDTGHLPTHFGVKPVEFSVLVPNAKGMSTFVDFSDFQGRFLAKKVSVFTAASETFNRKNVNATISETLERFRSVIDQAKSHQLKVRGYVSCVIECPFEGPIQPSKVAEVVRELKSLGVDEFDLGDTIGAGTADSVSRMLRAVMAELDPERTGAFWTREAITLHLHDTFGRAADCVKVALDMGVRSFDGSVAGLGGCPYASKKLPDGTIQRAPGNISTELLVQTIEDAGYETGVDRDALAKAAAFAREIVAKSRAAT